MKIVTVILLLLSHKIYAETCEEVKVRIIFNKKAVITKEILCQIKTVDHMLFYISKSCADNACEIMKRKKYRLLIKDYNSNLGSPGFKLCTELDGVPQIFEFSKGSDIWESSERCLFGARDFVEISYLTREWKALIQKDNAP